MALKDILSKFNNVGVNDNPATSADEFNYKNEVVNPPVQKVEQPEPEQDVYKPLFEGYYRNTVKQPKELSEKGIKSSRTVANLGDTFSLLGEMIGAGAGGRVQRRNATVAAEQSQNEKQAVAQNNAEMNQWNQGLYSAKTQDAVSKMNYDREKRANAIAMIKHKDDYELASKKIISDYNKWLEDHNLKVSEASRRKFEADRKYQLDVFKANKPSASSTASEKEDKNYVQVNIAGKPYSLAKTYVQDVVTRARKLPENIPASQFLPNPLQGMSDNEIFTKYKDQYLDVTDDGKVLVGHFPKYMRDRQQKKQSNATQSNNDPLGLGL